MQTIPKSRIKFDESSLLSLDDRIELQTNLTKQPKQNTVVKKGVVPVHDLALDIVKSGGQLLPQLPIDREREDAKFLANQMFLDEIILKAGLSTTQIPDAYDNLNSELRQDDKKAIEENEEFRRAINSISTAWNSLGVYRSDFIKNDNDKMCRNAIVSIVEKAFLDYFGSLDWDIVDKDTGDREDRAYDFLSQPNPQDSFSDVIVPACRDLFRYDAGAIVKTFNRKKELIELKSYLGTEFWIEMDRVPQIISVPANDNAMGIQAINDRRGRGTNQGNEVMMQGWWSRGFAWRYWQRSQTGVYIPYTPSEVCYLARYKRSDNIYGTDYLKFLKYQVQYLIDSTVAAGKTFQNGLVPSMIIQHPQVHAIEQIQQRITQIRMDNTGPTRLGSVMHLVNGEDAKIPSQHLHDMEWLEGQKYISQLIWGYFGFTPDEFTGGDSSRATAYVKRNITKSRLLYPMMRYFEDKINREILPHLKGYKKSWRFHFIRELELDDKQKMAQTGAIRTATFLSALDRGISERVAIKMSNDEILNRHDVEEIISARESFKQEQMMQEFGGDMGGSGDGTMEDGEQGRYGTGSETYQPMNFSDYGQGGENTEQRFGIAEEKEYQKADPMNFDIMAYVKGMTFRRDGRLHEVTFADDRIVKAKVYVKDVKDIPEGRSYKQGTRGGYYYLTTLKQQEAHHKKKRKGGSGGAGGDGEGDADEHSAPSPPDLQGAEKQVKVTGNGVGIVAGLVNGKLQGKNNGSKETAAFMKKVKECSGGDQKKILPCMTSIAKEEGLKVSS